MNTTQWIYKIPCFNKILSNVRYFSDRKRKIMNGTEYIRRKTVSKCKILTINMRLSQKIK
ncbi:hypothetical protein PFFVO_03641 [Plasmodium falciparum Vietnam Oak-Knoll (FVO)]|uniref:Uncharacterized protein n=1 Tax=Plasmodium falciparum Vietnam Oak-Knoll (FVO) TaxID=1036723 RepID=A0A024V5J1_PLAFA|nr:hypothetical protein PFFVO_03641 [Plasmodium falciparum Vietnam Oak-Knoll (FVO)]